jgi:hypothetical protein
MSETSKLNPNAGEGWTDVQPLRRRSDPVALASLLEEWMHEDEQEQRETFEFLRRALDEDRPAGYRLFS